MTFKAHFDGKAIIPDEPVALKEGESLVVTAKPAYTTGKGMTGAEVATWLKNEEPIWQDVGDTLEFARKLREELNRPRYRVDFD